MRRPYGVRINTVGRSPDSVVGNQRSARRTAPSGILAARSRSTEMLVLRAGGRPTNDAAIRLHTVMDDPLCSPVVTPGCLAPR